MTEDAAGRGISRRRLGGGMLALGGALALAPIPFAGQASAMESGAGSSDMSTGAGGAASGHGRPTLRRGSAERAGLLQEPLDQLVTEAEKFLAASPKHPWYAGAVLLAGRGGTVALHRPVGKAVRYAAYDEKSDTGVEFPPDQQIPMAEDTVFDLASVSKLFTSILAVQQIERGTLELEAKVASYLPDFAGGGKQDITIRQLLTHTSGFRAWIPLYKAPTREGKLQLLWDEVPASPPGTVYLYSDLNLISLQLVLEKLTGRTQDVLLREQITAPLGMHRTRYNPPASWKPKIAATEDARLPWSGLDRGLVWGEVHDENAYSLDGVAGHAGVFSCAWDLAILARTLLNGGVYGRARILSAESVDLLFTDFNTSFPGDAHGLGFELYQHWYMGAMATPRTAGHTGFTGTSLVLDPTTDSFLIVLGNSVHPVRSWRSGSAPRVATANQLARAVAVRPARGRTAWFSGMASAASATLTLPPVRLASSHGRLSSALWWDTEPGSDFLFLEVSADAGATWQPVPFSTVPTSEKPRPEPEPHPTGAVSGWSGRAWHRLDADLAAWRGKEVRLRWRYTTDQLYVGRGAYVDAVRVEDGNRTLFDESRSGDAARIEALGWTASAD
ncbi:serine hydrolase [Streptomyces sp. NBC_00053]|uniref:serine hydrolase domain-containing protein n=1 Tax=unclassified Streptomyces TaxID=2593676 RepID=UPI000F5B88FC|nr:MULTISPECIES: serine hydrolase domain-containing protein [unclassified Streptomyces]WSG48906.1 serine hydrolase [Streptomyces sp. NBC_01732]WSW99556.1 serine hydrolase [Streptomyces sp. NBC_00987]MCX5158028.1 serine hydrolase [Streptomyces sp. NBC_00305]MCX5216551.1 serine hydrolase [Streptomyces sp. NBC_00264]MCX5498458.1 serine hydrolase [Streptomyces sp. NBC_00052]